MSTVAAIPLPIREIERIVWSTPFGLKLWDAAEAQIVSEDLRVRVFPRSAGASVESLLSSARRNLGGPVTAQPNRSGIFVLRRLPGSPAARRFRLAVSDSAERFQRFVLDVELPMAGGLVGLSPAAAGAEPMVPVFPTPARLVPAGLASLRAEFIQAADGLPAAFAVLEVRHEGVLLARTIADANGRLLAMFAYPEPKPVAVPASPPRSTSLLQQTWVLDLAVYHRPGIDAPVIDAGEAPFPELGEVLKQPPAQILEDGISLPRTMTTATLAYGRELVLRSGFGAAVLPLVPGGA